MPYRRPIPRWLQSILALFLVGAVLYAVVAPGAVAAAPGGRPRPLAAPGELSPQRLLSDILEWLGGATTHLVGKAADTDQGRLGRPRPHFGFGRGALLAQTTPTGLPLTGTPTAIVSAVPTVSPGTVTAIPTVSLTPGVSVPGVPIYPSHGELVPGRASVVPVQGEYRLQSARHSLAARAVLDQCIPSVQVSAQTTSQQTLQVTITANGQGNVVQQVYFPVQNAQNAGDRFSNAFVSFSDQAISAEILDRTYVLTPPQQTLTMWVSAMVPGQPTHVPLVVRDSCGDWQTFVGGGTSAALSCLWVEAVPTGTEHNLPYINGGTVGGVHTLTGSFSTNHTDVSVGGLGPTPQLTRTYNSNDPRPGPLGQGWRHSYTTHVARPPDGSQDLVLVGGQGRSDRYTYTGDPNGYYAPPAGVFTTLQKRTDGSYLATALDQRTWTFDGCGHLTTLKDPYGNTSTLTYDTATYHLTGISDPAGRSGAALTLSYYNDANGRLRSLTDGLGRHVTYEYDSSGRLSKVHDRMPGTPDGGTITGNVTTFSYDGASARLTAINDARRPTDSPCPSTPIPGCTVVTNSYDSSGKVHSQTDAAGQQTTFTYRTNPPGADITFPATSYEPTFHLTQSDSYDGHGWLTTEVSRPESGVSYTVSHTYDASTGVRTATTDARGNTTTYCYDVSTAGTALGTRGLLTRVIAPSVATSDAGTTRPTTLTEYDGLNRPTRVYSPRGVNTVAVPPTCSANYTVPNALDLAYATDKAYSARNELTAVTRRYYSYDQSGNRTGAMQTATTTYEYAASWPGRVTFETPPRGNQGAQPDHAYATAHTYYGPGDPQAGLEASTQPPAQRAVYRCYDAVGRLTARSDGAATATTCTATDHHWDYSYDNEDRLLSTTSPPTTAGGARLVTSSTYDGVGQRLSATDAMGNITRFSYDGRGLLTQVRHSKDFADPNSDSNPLIAQYAYDNLGRRQWVFKLVGTTQVRQAQYLTDGLGRLRQEIEYPGSGTLTRSYGYDANGNRLTQDNPNGGHIASAYDALNRVTGITYTGGNGTPTVTYQYDRGGRRTRMSTAVQGDSLYTYDERDALVRVETPYVGSGSVTKVVRYSYDPDGNRSSLTYPNDDQLTYTRDPAGRVARVTDWLSRATTFQYDVQDGRLTEQDNVNGTKQTRLYDNLRRLSQLNNRYSTDVVITSDSYTLDANGNPLTIARAERNACSPLPCTPSLVAFTETYSYDRVNRITSFTDPDPWPPSSISQTYDAAHNMATFTETFPQAATQSWTNTLNGADWLTQQNRATPAGNWTFNYDANGNLFSSSNTLGLADFTFSYNIADRPLSVMEAGVTANFAYDGDGVRVVKTVGSSIWQYVYDRAGQVPVLLEDGHRRYVPGPTGVLYTTDLGGVGNPQLIYHTDRQGSVRAITDYSTQLVYSTRYEPYGNARHTASNNGYSAQPLGYVGAPFDPEGAVIYLHARYYAPGMARFIQRDSLFGSETDPVSLNRYAYARNNPMVFTDPSGRDPEVPMVSGAGSAPDCSYGYGSCPGYDGCYWLTGVQCGVYSLVSLEDFDALSYVVLTPFLGGTGGRGYAPPLNVPAGIGVPVGQNQYPLGSQVRVNAWGAAWGCHTCGAILPPGENYIRDHWPPSVLVRQGVYPRGQFLLPQCPACNEQQSAAASRYAILRRQGVPHEELTNLVEQMIPPYSLGWPYIGR